MSQTVTVTNAYPATKQLKLIKTAVGDVPASLGDNPKYKFRVTLTAPTSPADVDLSKYNITKKTGASGTAVPISGIKAS